MNKIVIVGASGYAKVIIDCLEKQGKYEIVGLIDSFKKNLVIANKYHILGREEDLPLLVEKYLIDGVFIAIGDNWNRHLLVKKIKNILPELKFVSITHPSAQIAYDVTIGEGVALLPGSIVNAGSKIGNFCILNTNASLDHDCQMEDFASLAPGVVTGGNVNIGAFSAVSLGAKIIHGITIGSYTVIGAGATVVHDIQPHCVAYGTPAKVIRHRQMSDKYL